MNTTLLGLAAVLVLPVLPVVAETKRPTKKARTRTFSREFANLPPVILKPSESTPTTT
jgi:hypothetical protein